MEHIRFNAPPGWPSPPGGWVPDATWRPDPSWPPAPPGWQWWLPTIPAQAQPTAPTSWSPQPPSTPGRPPRSTATRVALTLLILLGPWLAFMTTAFAFGVFLGLTGSANPSDQSIDSAVGVLTFLLIIGYVAWFAFVATKVSYRWFDTLVLLIPIYSFIWLIRISWRFSLLPHKNWQTRAGESPAGQWPPAPQWTPAQQWTQPPQWTPAAAPYGAVNQPLSGHYPPATFRGEQLAAPAQPESPTDPFSAPR